MSPTVHGAVTRRSLRRHLTSALAAALVVGGLLWFIGSLPYALPLAVLAVLLAGLVTGLALWGAGSTSQDVEQAYWVSTPRQESAPPDAMDYRLLRLRRDLRDALDRDDRGDEIYPVVRALAAERLLAHHDIDLDTEPERAQDVLDPHLWGYLTHPPTDTRRRSKSALHTAIEGVEKL
ncbi:hypothetical protein SGUI_1104 [Serinicoccus hydrothermalis]|uniref:Uncharacterized protein n=1 Tax=Serinicoccus hydrothermalis TaxID=1758689 RepID=A0A1B1NAN3_9MICO|nr:hypothetical protein [Serinicoccus hydrothermalis]ANS78500.1 hypothetical protein SGUI_1104 [Serinicoccus hydrothermalis]